MNERGDFERMSGKEANANKDDLERLERSFAGMVEMKRLPGALFVIDCKKERLAVNEANKLGIPIVAVVDTNCDPDLIQHVDPRQRRRHPLLPADGQCHLRRHPRGPATAQRARAA